MEELQKQNQELNERLKKASTIYKEQKAEILRITTERDEFKVRLEKCEEQIKILESKNAKNEEKNTEFFDLLDNIDSLNEKVEEYKKSIDTLNEEKTELQQKNQDLENAIDSLEKSQQEYKKQCSKLIEAISNTIEEQTKTLNTSISNIIKEVGI